MKENGLSSLKWKNNICSLRAREGDTIPDVK